MFQVCCRLPNLNYGVDPCKGHLLFKGQEKIITASLALCNLNQRFFSTSQLP